MNLSRIQAVGANLEHANLKSCRLDYGNFTEAHLGDAVFSGAVIRRARFIGAINFCDNGARYNPCESVDKLLEGSRIQFGDLVSVIYHPEINGSKKFDIIEIAGGVIKRVYKNTGKIEEGLFGIGPVEVTRSGDIFEQARTKKIFASIPVSSVEEIKLFENYETMAARIAPGIFGLTGHLRPY